MNEAVERLQRNAHRGQVLVLFALSSLVLLAAMGLVMDGGYNFAMRRAMQNAADAAALAGSQLLAGDPESTQILSYVQSVAMANGVESASDVTCRYVTDANLDGVAYCQANTAPPTNLGTITGVKVSVTEEHGTFALRVVGIFESGTGADAVAQVQTLGAFTGSPFTPCGVETMLVNEVDGEDVFSILNTTSIPVYGTGKHSDTIVDWETVAVNDGDGYASINPDAYSFDWTGGLGTGLPKPGSDVEAPDNTPNFLIHSPQIERCGLHDNSWKGLNGTEKLTLPALADDDTTHSGQQQGSEAVTGTRAGPTRAVAGLFGCGEGEGEGCIMVLPIADTSAGRGEGGSKNYVAARLWGAFWVTQVSSNEHAGRLIANYPLTGAGTSGWSSNYSGPIVVRLVR